MELLLTFGSFSISHYHVSRVYNHTMVCCSNVLSLKRFLLSLVGYRNLLHLTGLESVLLFIGMMVSYNQNFGQIFSSDF